MSNQLSEKWIKASIAGTIWAASEIVLGSFLHNLRIPFSGNILTAIGLVILISLSYKWTDRGLFWRAGIICAIMKTLSPSAVIFGPMIAILSEAALLEISVRALGRSFAGFALGGMLAMSWNLFQKIFNYIIFYGFNIVDLYTNVLKYAQKQLNIQFDIIWLPIIALLVIYCLFGLASAITGITVGRRILKQPGEFSNADLRGPLNNKNKPQVADFKYSIAWLLADMLLMIGALVVLNYTFWPVWSLSIICLITLWAFRYKRALRQLSKPKFWIFFVIITMITAFIFTRTGRDSASLHDGLLIGLQMNFRAAVIIVGFAVLGTELYNPRVREFFLMTSFRQLPLALELSFESLPLMIANIPEFKIIVRKPALAVSRFIALAEMRLEEMKNRGEFSQHVFILTGYIGQGKSRMVRDLINDLTARKIKLGGIYSSKIIENGNTSGYEVVDFSRNRQERFLKLAEDDKLIRVGKYSVLPEGLNLGLNALRVAENLENQIVVIDEVGALELNDRGWSGKISDLIKASNNHLLLVVRDSLVSAVLEKWKFSSFSVFNISENDCHSISEKILTQIRNV